MPKGLVYDSNLYWGYPIKDKANSGKLVYGGPSSGKLVYTDHANANVSNRTRMKTGDGRSVDIDTALSEAYNKMIIDPWTEFAWDEPGDAHVYASYSRGAWTVQCRASMYRLDMLNDVDATAMGRTALQISVDMEFGNDPITPWPSSQWRIGIRTSDDSTISDDWSWLDTAPSTVGATDNTFVVIYDPGVKEVVTRRAVFPGPLVIKRYLFVFMSLDPYYAQQYGFRVGVNATRYIRLSF